MYYDLSVGQVHGEAPERLAALAEAAGGVLLRQEYLMAEPVRHLKLILTLVPTGTGAGLCILGKLKVYMYKYYRSKISVFSLNINEPATNSNHSSQQYSHLLHEDPVSLGELLQPHHAAILLLQIILGLRLGNHNV